MILDHAKSVAASGVLLAMLLTVCVFVVQPACPPSPALLFCRAIFPAVGVASLALAIWAHRRRNIAPDLMGEMFKKSFDASGLSLAVDTESRDGVGYFDVYFQNRCERGCQTRIVLQRLHGLALSSQDLRVFSTVIECPGGAFGCVQIPVPVPGKYQGRKRPFELTADVTYPGGRGRLLRFHPGRRIGAKGSPDGAVLVLALVGGIAGFAAAAARQGGRLRLRYPDQVAETPSPDLMPRTELMWLPGDESDDTLPGVAPHRLGVQTT